MSEWICDICGEKFPYFDDWFWHIEAQHNIYDTYNNEDQTPFK